MNKSIVVVLALLISGCASTPSTVSFNNKMVSTYGVSAGCGTLLLEQDCSQMSGSTREIEINEFKLRIAGSNNGKIVFVMSMPKFLPDEKALSEGAEAIEDFFLAKGIKIMDTKVMYGSGKVFGVHYTLDSDGYSYLKGLSVKS